ncbi:S-layer homology domain-containing protein, partial [Anaerotignum sp.]
IEVTVPYKENSETGNVAVEVTKADGTKEVIEDVYDGKNSVTFEVDGSVTFEIIDDYVPLADVPVVPEQSADNPFKDVSETDWFYNAVMYVSANGLMSGVDADNFGPSWNTTRGMITTILWRMEGKPAAGTVPFADVDADMYYADAIAWAAENGIVSGYDAMTFGPDNNITREQLASILYRYTKYKGEGFEGVWAFRLDFSDVNELSEYAYEPMCWCVMNGIISGNDDGTLDPAGHAQRAHAAQMLMKFLENE